MVSDAHIHFTVLQTVNVKYDLNTQVGGPATFLFLLGFGDSSAYLYLVLETDLKSFIKDMLRSLWEWELEAREPKSAAQPFCFLWFCSALWNSLSSWFFLGTPLTENKREWCHYKEKQERKSYSMREKKIETELSIVSIKEKFVFLFFFCCLLQRKNLSIVW